jgi:hypothetical protein
MCAYAAQPNTLKWVYIPTIFHIIFFVESKADESLQVLFTALNVSPGTAEEEADPQEVGTSRECSSRAAGSQV